MNYNEFIQELEEGRKPVDPILVQKNTTYIEDILDTISNEKYWTVSDQVEALPQPLQDLVGELSRVYEEIYSADEDRPYWEREMTKLWKKILTATKHVNFDLEVAYQESEE